MGEDILDAQRTLDEERQLLRTVFANIAEGVMVTDAEGRMLDMNAEALRLHGFDDLEQALRDLKDWPEFDVRSMDGRPVPRREWPAGRAVAGERFVDYVIRVRNRRTGEEGIWSYSGGPVLENGRIVSAVLTMRDVTEQHRRDEELEFRSALLESVSDSVIVYYLDEPEKGKLVYVNEAAYTSRGFTRDEMLRMNVTDLVAPEWRPRLDARLGRVAAGEQVRAESGHLRKDGTSFPVEVWLRRVDFGRPLVVNVSRDITERKAAEEAVRESLVTERAAARYSEALNEVDADVAAAADVAGIMQAVVERTARAVEADVGMIYMPSPGGWEARFTWNAPAWLAGTQLTEQELPYSVTAARDRRVELFADAEKLPGWETSVARRLGATQVLDAPLRLGGDEVGDFTMYKLRGRRFTEADRDFLQKVSASVSLALQNMRRYENERQVADTLQEALLQLPDRLPGIEFAHSYHSAAEAARVGGDFYDLFELEAGILGITMGDISGKGLRAAVLTSLVKNAIRAQATEPGKSPASVMHVVNTLVLRSSPAEAFATVFVALLDRTSGSLVYCNAGHTTGALCRRDGRIDHLTANSPLAGALPESVFADTHTVLAPGELLFLYTDGLTEARSPSRELFGEDRVFATLVERAGGPQDVVDRLLTAAVSFAGGRLSDDLAMLALELIGTRP